MTSPKSNPKPTGAAEIAHTAIAVAAKTAAGKTTATRGEAPGIVKRSNSYHADPRTIVRRKGWNPRFDFGDIEALKASVLENGVLNPLRVKRISGDGPAFFELIDGDRRLTAIEQLIKEKKHFFSDGVPVIIVDRAQNEITDLIQMFVANDGKPFLPLEECAAYMRMKEANMTIKQICDAVGRKQVHVIAILALASADESLKQAVQDGTINKTLAKDIAVNARGDKAKQAELTKEAVAAGKDKAKRRVIVRKVDEARQTKAVKKGKRVPKMRALSDLELSELGASVAARMPKLLLDAKAMMHEKNLEKWISQDDKLALACAFGQLQALKAAAGIKVKLEL